ncbi:MAG: hypothetical protein ACRDI2_13090 [Chloroflexota bacterium]
MWHRLHRARWPRLADAATIAGLHRHRRVLVRYERYPELHDAFLALGCALIGWRFLERDGSCQAL